MAKDVPMCQNVRIAFSGGVMSGSATSFRTCKKVCRRMEIFFYTSVTAAVTFTSACYAAANFVQVTTRKKLAAKVGSSEGGGTETEAARRSARTHGKADEVQASA